MTKKHTYRVPLPDGSEATRTTARTYTHIVIGKPSEADARKLAEQEWAHDESNFAYYRTLANGGVGYVHDFGRGLKANPQTQADLDDVTAKLRGATTLAEFRAAMLAERIAVVDGLAAEGHYTRFHVVGWAGRPDLAEKLLRGPEGSTLLIERQIVPVPPIAS